MSSGNGVGGDQVMGYAPLYLKVKQLLLDRMISGEWPPGTLLPSEQQLGSQIGVSQGTVRKALDALAAERLVVRRQGRGTFVSQHDQTRTLFQFFKLVDKSGEKRFPETISSKMNLATASAREAGLLGLEAGSKVWRIRRHRVVNKETSLVERIAVAADSFDGLGSHQPLPNNIYQLFEKEYGITVARAVEEIRAVLAGKEDATTLGCGSDEPVLRIDRVAYGLDGRPVELRTTLCPTHSCHYLSDLR